MNLYVIGRPVDHSLSPLIHNYWLKKYKKKEVYGKLDLDEKDLQEIINKVSNKEILGVNVTIPYKQKIYSLLKNLNFAAKASFAVNTIYHKDEKAYGDNTDGKGFCEALIQETNFDFKEKKVLVLGAGGASYGVVSEILTREVDEIFISNRTQKKSELLIQSFNNNTKKIKSLNWENLTPDESIDLIVNTTSVGLKEGECINMNLDYLSKKVIYSDLIYNPKRTETMKIFEEKGLFTQNGLGMLVNQAALSFKLWFDINLTLEDINEAKELCEKSN